MTKYNTGRAATMKTGPNDARRVIWAVGECFILSLCVFPIPTNVLLIQISKYVTGRAATAKIGPNDAHGVVWAIG